MRLCWIVWTDAGFRKSGPKENSRGPTSAKTDPQLEPNLEKAPSTRGKQPNREVGSHQGAPRSSVGNPLLALPRRGRRGVLVHPLEGRWAGLQSGKPGFE